MIYDVYHDESKENGYWHGFLFVPRSSRDELLNFLRRSREINKYPHAVHYASAVRRSADVTSRLPTLIQAWTEIACAALQQQKFEMDQPRVSLGRIPKRGSVPESVWLKRLLKCRFVLFREKGEHEKMYEGMSGLDRIETTFRMALKGGVSHLFSALDPIEIGNLFIDGDEHYWGQYRRSIDVKRTLHRFAAETPPFVTFTSAPTIIPQRSYHTKIEPHQNREDSEFLQLCDVLIGGFRFHTIFGDNTHPRFAVSRQCLELLNHDQGNAARMKNSRHYRGFHLSNAWLSNGQWNFAEMEPACHDAGMPTQMCLVYPTDG